jgi:hypothetical protein
VKLSSVDANADKKKQQNFILSVFRKIVELGGFAIEQICNVDETVLF